MDAVEIFVADEQAEVPVDTLRWVRLARMVLEAERDDKKMWGDCELSMIFIDETSMADLNERFLGREGPTDVLAFPMDDEVVESGRQPDQGGRGPGAPAEPGDAPTLIGDVVICPGVAKKQAPEHGASLDEELALLVVHGVLHLLGFDHEEDDEAEAMEQREQELLQQFRALEGSATS
jgi:probable rRNA maturation factor